MNPKDEALVTAIKGLETLKPHRSSWVREVVEKTLKRINILTDTESLIKEYEEDFNRRIKK